MRILFPGAGLLVPFRLVPRNTQQPSARFPFLQRGRALEYRHGSWRPVWFGPHAGMNRLAGIVAWASVIGSAAQVLAQLPAVLRLVPAMRIQLATHLESVRTVIRNFGPVFVSRGVVQLSAYIDAIIASYLPTGAMAALTYAQTLYLLPVSLFGMSVSASELPVLSVAFSVDRKKSPHSRCRLVSGLRRIASL